MITQIKFVVDVGVGRSIENWLTSQSFSVFSIGLINAEMTDAEILQLAFNENAILITMDKDFGELIFKNHSLHTGVLLLRLEDAVVREKLSTVQNIIPEHLQNLKDNFSVYQNGKLRVR